MRIRIVKRDEDHPNAWYNGYIGSEFEAAGYYYTAPEKYYVRDMGFVPIPFTVEVLDAGEEIARTPIQYIKPTAEYQTKEGNPPDS